MYKNERPKYLAVIAFCLFVSQPWQALAQQPATPALDLTELSLESLMDLKVTSVSKRKESWSEAAAAIFVITQEDIRRSGATSIPEALRLAPGLQVARIDSSRWAISSRGSNGLFANKLLVLIDGRSVYTPLFSGVWWDTQDTLIEDIDRIEVIRGPGATLWGANAVNGIINVITKNSAQTEGWLASAGAGNFERGFTALRYGTKFDQDSSLRVYGKTFDRDSSPAPNGDDGYNGLESYQGGFRFDRSGQSDKITVQGDIYEIDEDSRISFPQSTAPYSATVNSSDRASGGNILGAWTHSISETSITTLQLYYDRTNRDDSVHTESFDTYDIDFSWAFNPMPDHQAMVGLGYRAIGDDLEGRRAVDFTDNSRSVDVYSGFIQDEIALASGAMHLTLGSKFEENDYTGFEIQPSARLSWQPSQQQTIWGAVSRAVSTPSRAIDDIILDFGVVPGSDGNGSLLRVYGDHDSDVEELIAYELGYRIQPESNLSLDLALFYNDYTQLSTVESAGQPFLESEPLPPHAVVPFSFDNLGEAYAYGAEFVATWQVRESWQLQGWYSYFDMEASVAPESTASLTIEGDDPRNQFSLRSLLKLSSTVELDSRLRYVDSIQSYDIESYTELDLRLGWHLRPDLEISLAGMNLLHDQHAEYVANFISIAPAEIERSFYGKVTWSF